MERERRRARRTRFALAMLLAAGTAHANGRPPLTDGVHFRPGDSHSLYVSTTFGLLISHDDGCTFNWICETNIGYGGPFDPKYAIATDGTIFATTFNGLRISRDGGCSFVTATAQLPANDPNRIDFWIDALDIGPTGEVWVGTAESARANDVFVSTDNGVTFSSRGMLSPTVWWKSVKVAPSNAQRVYITGYQVAGALPDGGQMQPTAHLFRSDDDGAHWLESPLAGVQYGSMPTLLAVAVDPKQPNIVYVRSIQANPPMGDRLYRSTDGGMTLTEVLATTDAIRDVVVLDATQVLVATQTGGSFRSTDGGVSFSAMGAQPQLACLGQRDDGALFGCGANWDPDFKAVARSADGGASWQKVWRFVELAGPMQCPAGTPEYDMCDQAQWANLRAQFGATGPSCGIAPDPPADAAAPPVASKKSGCCDASDGAPTMVVLTLVLALLLTRRRAA
ncbi:MAG: hypothetical protein JWO36_440 [Myxococcales bacterium]|nr:hypothetical protein [Myxococcales bacterium]